MPNTHKERERETGRQTEEQKGKQRERQTNRQVECQKAYLAYIY